MKAKRFLLAVFALLTCIQAWSEDGDIFKATVNGIEWTFQIISETDKTCRVGRDYGEVAAIPTDTSGDLIIPASVNDYRVVEIGRYAFSSCTGLTSVTIPSSVTAIGGYSAFSGCTGLTSIEIPNSVTSIGYNAFSGCTGLTSIEIPNSVTSIEDRAFSGCSSLTSIVVSIDNSIYDSRNYCNAIINSNTNELIVGCNNTIIPNSVTSIGDYAFYRCSGLKTISIPNSVTSIGQDAFELCTDLTTISIPNSVTSISHNAFSSCSGLTSVSISNSVTNISDWTFSYCSSLTSVSIPNSVTSIGKEVFKECSGLTSVSIPNSVTSIGVRAFWGCSNLKKVIVADIASWCDITIDSSGESNPLYFAHHLYSDESTEITDLEIPEGVTHIRNFSYCTGLTSVSVPNSVTSIGNGAFSGCTGLTSIVVSEGNTVYDSRNDCNAIIKSSTNELIIGCKNTIIPNGVTSIGGSAFSRCSGLTAVAIPNSVTSIGNNAFYDCTGLTTISIPNSVTSIGDGAFWNCSNLTSVTINRVSPISINSLCFTNRANATLHVPYGCIAAYKAASYWKEFKEIIELPVLTFSDAKVKDICVANWDTNGDGELSEDEAAAVTELGQVFRNNKNITSFNELQYFTGLTSINDNAFSGCSGLTSVAIPNSVTSIGSGAFSSCSGLTSVHISDIAAWCKISFNNYLSNPLQHAHHLFINNEEIKDLIIPNSVTSIGSNAFDSCYGLTSVTIPNSVTSIGESAFWGCTGLTSITIPNSVTSIGESAFQNCTGLTSVTIGNSVTSIGSGAFYACTGLTSVTIPNSVTFIGYSAFQNCIKLTSVTIPNSVTSIEDYTFNTCWNLTSVTIGNSVTSIGEKAFYDCKKLTSVIIPNSVTSIGNSAFLDCSGLSSVHISDISAWCEISFNGYDSNPLSYAHHLFINNEEIKDLIIPNSVTSIGSNAFYDCSSLTSVTIPNSVTSIGESAFWGCSGLTSVTIPNSVTSIENYAFAYCSGLTSVIVENEIPLQIESNVFSNRANATLYVPTGCKAAYEAADYWNEFKEIVEMGSDDFEEGVNTLFGSDLQASSGKTIVLPVILNNENEVKLCQFDLQLPTGVTVATKSNGKLDVTLTERAENHSVSSTQLGNGDYRFIVASLDNDSFTGNDGTLLNITLVIPATMEGEYTIKIHNAELSVPNGNDLIVVKPADTQSELIITTYTPGDVNDDGSVSVTDVGCAINYILEQIPSVFIFAAADMNGDNNISVTDVGMIINLILSGETTSAPGMEGNNEIISPSLSLMPTNDGYELLLENKEAYIGLQFDVQLADGANFNGIQLTGSSEHLLTYHKLTNGKYRVICYSLSNSSFDGNDSSLMRISTSGNVIISDIRLTTVGLSELTAGDMNAATTGIADMMRLNQTSELKVYTLDGLLCRVISAESGENPLSGLKPGVYMIGNRKVVLK